MPDECENCKKLKASIERRDMAHHQTSTRLRASEAALIHKANQLLHIKRILNNIPTEFRGIADED